jgi:hypothetical protein
MGANLAGEGRTRVGTYENNEELETSCGRKNGVYMD